MTKRLERIIKNFQLLRIGVVGDLMLDRIEKGKISKRKNPENQDVPIINALEEFYLGGCGNVARNLSSLGAIVDLYGRIGDDLYGHQIVKLCEQENISRKYLIIEKNIPTVLKARIFIDGKYKHRSDLGEFDKNYESNLKNLNEIDYAKILQNIENNINKYNAIILSDYNKKIFTNDFSQEIIQLANSRDIPVICDVKPQNLSYFKGCFAVCPNMEEAEKMSGITYNGQYKTLQDIARKISEENQIDNIIITRSEKGMFTYNSSGSENIPSYAKVPLDSTGAGDTVTALWALGIISGLNAFESSVVASIGAGIVVEKLGTAVTTQKEILERIKILGKGL